MKQIILIMNYFIFVFWLLICLQEYINSKYFNFLKKTKNYFLQFTKEKTSVMILDRFMFGFRVPLDPFLIYHNLFDNFNNLKSYSIFKI